jgi:hypothetical protein
LPLHFGFLATRLESAIFHPLSYSEIFEMALTLKPGKSVRVTISKTINRDSARKTLERLFMRDKAVSDPIDVRSRNFKELPKRRGGCIWTKRPNKVHPSLAKGDSAMMTTTPQIIRDLGSVETFIEVK